MNNQWPPQNKNVVVVFWHLGLGGVQKKILDLAHYLKDTGWRLHIILRDKPRFRMDNQVNANLATIHYRPTSLQGKFRFYFPLYILWKLFVLNPTTTLAFLDAASVFTILATRLLFWRHIRVVLNEDTLPSQHTTSPLKRQLIRICYPLADVIISPTQVTKRDLVNNFHLPAQKIVVIPNWTTPFKRRRAHKYKYDLLYAGRFETQKNIISLLESILRLRKNKPNIRLCLIGGGEERKNIYSFIQRHKLHQCVTVLQATHDMSRFFQHAKIFTMTSQYEGMPVVLLEAMAAGIPVVVTRFPGIEEYLRHGKTGFIENNVNAFSRRLLKLLADDNTRRRVGNGAAQEVKIKFSKVALRKFASILLNVNEHSLP